MRMYGITGGAGSGKTEAAKRFAALGFSVFDADALGHEIIAPGGAAESAVLEAFGDAILTDGGIDRAKLGALVFQDSAARERLNAIMHPLIHDEVFRRAALLKGDRGEAPVIVDAALLAENGRKEPWMDGLILVLCSREERLRRLVTRRGLSPVQANQRMDAQSPPEKKLALADYVIHNEGSVEALWDQVDAIAKAVRNEGQ
ncbi:MAG TPA: dephospho-CoA kinase [Candidatus Hydrogenedentes bacterium]|nr:dephospho-CoA kinase [Candidatus Hydrogenedentota bacterium]